MGVPLLDKQPVTTRPPEVINEGMVPVVGANDVMLDATHNEVVMTFRLATGGGGPGQPLRIQETARIAMTWTFFEQLFTNCGQLLDQAHPVRIEATKAHLEALEAVAQASQAVADGPVQA